MSRTRRFGSIGLAATVAASSVAVAATGVTAGVAQAAPGTPGSPQAPQVVYTEDFEHGMGNTAVRVTDYTGAPPVTATYDADPAWLANCDGWVTDAVAPDPPGSGCNGRWFSLQNMAATLGEYTGTGPANHALGEESAFVAPGADKVVAQTATPIPLSGASRFLTFSVDVTEVGCAGLRSLLKFYLMDGTTAIPTFSTPIEACVNPPETINGVPVGTYTSNGPVLFSGAAMGLRLVNGQGGFAGNDFAIDNIRVLDVTPQLDKSFGPTTVQENGATTLTYTVTNTSERAVKTGWAFTDTLPAGLATVPGSASTDCSGGTATATAATVTVAGNLDAGQAACTATVRVTAAAPGTYQSCGPNVTVVTGVSRPGCAGVTFTAAPSVDAGGPYAGQEGAAIAIAGAMSDPDSPNATVSWAVAPTADVDPGATCAIADPADPTTSVRCTDDGTFTLTRTADDGLNEPVAASTTVTVANVAPAVTITAPAGGVVVPGGSTVDVAADVTDAGANDTHACTVDFGDGTPVVAGTVTGGTCSASHALTESGAHEVMVTVRDDDGAAGTDTVTVVVNSAPVVDAGGPYAGQEGAAIAIAGAVTDPDDPDVSHSWEITPAAGVDAGATCDLTDAGAVATTVTCTDDGTFTLTLTADDGLNPPVAVHTTLTLFNQAPTVEITEPTDGVMVATGATVAVTAPFADPGANDTHTCTTDFDDATPVADGTVTDDTCTTSHTFTDPGTHNVLVTIHDDDGASATDVVAVVVNAPPVVDAGGPYAGVEGAETTVTGEVTDPDGPDLTTSWAVEPGAGVDPGATCAVADAGAVATTVTCTDDGTFTLTRTADDGLNAPVTATATLTVANAAPVVAISAPADGTLFERGDPVPVTAPFTDAGANDTHTCAVDFGDGPAVAGTVAGGTCAATHAFTALGPHPITVTVTDDDGGTDTDTVLVVAFVPGEAWALNASGPVTIAKTPHAVCPPDATLTQVGLTVPGVVDLDALNAACTVSPTTGTTRATASIEGASLLGGVLSISTIESTCVAGPDGLTGSSRVGTINGRPIGGGSGSITIPLVATIHYNQTVTTPTGELFQYAIRVRTLLGEEIVLGGCRVG